MRNRALLGLILGLFSFGAMAQKTDVYEEFSVSLQQVQVRVSTRGGEPIKDLKAEDFMVKLDGKKQTIATVEEINLNTMSVAEATELPEQGRRLFVFFFDFLNGNKYGVLEGRRAAIEFLEESMKPKDMAAIFTFSDRRNLMMISNFTSDKEQLSKGLATLGLVGDNKAISGYTFRTSVRASKVGFTDGGSTALDGQTAEPSSEGGGIAGNLGSLANQLDTDLQNALEQVISQRVVTESLGVLDQFESFAKYLSMVRGHKNIIYFSNGIPGLEGVSNQKLKENAQQSSFGGYATVNSNQLGSGSFQSSTIKLAEFFNIADAAFYSVDTNRLDRGSEDGTGVQFISLLANDTGGRVFTRENDFSRALNKVENITSHYYVVSFTPSVPLKPGEYSKLKVDVGVPKAQVQAAKGLYTPPAFKDMSQMERDLQISEFLERDQISQQVPVEADYAVAPYGNFMKVAVNVSMAGDYFSTLHDTREFEIFVHAISTADNRLKDQSYYRMRLAPEQLRQVPMETGMKYMSQLFLAPGDYKLKVVARDLVSGQVGSEIQPLKVEAKEGMLGPMLVQNSRWILLKEDEKLAREMRGDAVDLTHAISLAGNAVVPASSNEIDGSQMARFFYLMDYRDSAEQQEKPQLQVIFQTPKGEYVRIPPGAIKVSMELRDKEPFQTAALLMVDMAQLSLPAGTYNLMTQFVVPNKPPIRAMAPFVVK